MVIRLTDEFLDRDYPLHAGDADGYRSK